MSNIDIEIIIKIFPILMSILSIIYTRKIDKREEKRYEETIKNKLRYEALIISKEISYPLNRYSLEYDYIELRSKWFGELDVNTLILNKEDIPQTLGIQSKIAYVEYFDIYDCKELIQEFSKGEISKIENFFKLKESIDKLNQDLASKYECLNWDNDFIKLNSNECKEYLKTFGIIRKTYQLLFYILFEQEADDYIKIFKKIDKLSIVEDKEKSISLIYNYNLLKDKFSDHEAHLKNIEKRMDEIEF